MNCAVRKSIVT